MSRHSTAATRAARRRFWTSPVLYSLGRAIDRYSDAVAALSVCALVLVIVPVFGTMQDIPTPSTLPQFRYVQVTDQFNVSDPANNWQQLRDAYKACEQLNKAIDEIGACEGDAYELALKTYKPNNTVKAS